MLKQKEESFEKTVSNYSSKGSVKASLLSLVQLFPYKDLK